MNELPVIGSLGLHKDFGIATGHTMQLARKKCMVEGCFDIQKKVAAQKPFDFS